MNSQNSRNLWLARTGQMLLVVALSTSLTLLLLNRNRSNFGSTTALEQISKHSEQLVTRVLPSVVRVFVKKQERSQGRDELSTYFGENLAHVRADLGSGMLVHGDGFVLTNYHVVRDAVSIKVVSFDGKESVAELVGYDALTDLAILKTQWTNAVALEWDLENKLGTGALVWAFGSPFGLKNSVSLGIVSSSHGATLSDNPFQDYLQSDVRVNPGSSGGPLVGSNGRVVGVTTAIAGDRFEGVSFAIPSSLAASVAKELMLRGKIQRGWLGVDLSAVDVDRARRAGTSDVRGVYIQAVASGQKTDDSDHLVAGDICLQIDGRDINDPLLFSRTVASAPVGSKLNLSVIRNGKVMNLKIRVTERLD